MPLRSRKRLGRKPSGRKRVNVMIDPRKLQEVAAALDAPNNSAAIDAALDQMLEQHRFAEALENWGGRFPEFQIPGA
jgi:Arc/MetJ family transcription regulator